MAEEDRGQLGRGFVVRLSHLLKLASIHQLTNEALRQPVTVLLEFMNDRLSRGDALVLANHEGSFFLNHEPVRLDNATWESAEQLRALLTRLGVGEIGFVEPLTESDLRVFLAGYQKALGAPPGEILKLALPRVKLRVLDNAGTNKLLVDKTARLLHSYAQLLVVLDQTLPALDAGRNPEFARARRALQILVDASTGMEPLLVATSQLPRPSNGVTLHLAASATLALLLGMRLKLPRAVLVETAMAAAFHDLARGRPGQPQHLPPDQALARIPVDSMVPLAQWSGMETVLKCAAVAYEHGLPLDAPSGAPAGMSRLVAVACAWDLLRHPPPPRSGLAPPQALAVVGSCAGGRFDPWAVRLLASVCGAYPPGTLVSLNNGQLAMVVDKPDPADPVRVRVRLLPRAQPTPADLIVDLGDPAQNRQRLAIAGVVDARKAGVNIMDCMFFSEGLET